jgi:hypothetical protein
MQSEALGQVLTKSWGEIDGKDALVAFVDVIHIYIYNWILTMILTINCQQLTINHYINHYMVDIMVDIMINS